LVCATNFWLGFPALLGIAFGAYARGQIRLEPDRYNGTWMANLGILSGLLMLALIALLFFSLAAEVASCHGTWPDGCR
jgi:hypothetical protein